MKKSLMVVLTLLLLGSLVSCVSTKPKSKKTTYSKYMVNYKNGQYQVLIYPSDWDVISMIDTSEFKIDHIDTLQYKVKKKEIN